MRISEITNTGTPFPNSRIQEVLYHDTTTKFDKFRRDSHGIYVTPYKEWARTHYGKIIIPLYANVKKIIDLDNGDPEQDRIIDMFYDRDYDAVSKYLANLSAQGYDCCIFGGESESMVLIGNIQIVNAKTGKAM